MIPWVTLDRAVLPGGGEIRLLQRGSEFSIRLPEGELMNSRLSGSEEALAEVGCAGLARARPAVLIGGLGMGFTLRAALAILPPGASVVVAELVPAVVAWGRGPLAPLMAGSLDDPRTAIHVGDVGALLRTSPGRFDAVLLDVDNGPEAMTVAANDSLYGPAGLGIARAALRPGGRLAVWSAVPDDAFRARFARSGFRTEEHRVKAHRGRRGSRHVIWVGTRAG